MFDLNEVRKWINFIHAGSEGLIWVGRIGDMVGRTFSEVEDAVGWIADVEQIKPEGIYLRTTTLAGIPRDERGNRSRGGEDMSFTLPGFAADLDIAGPGHKTSHTLPPDEAEAVKIVATSGLPEPTVWVHSGGGLYPWWLLNESQDIRDEAIRTRAKDISEKIQKILVASGAALGWHVGGEVGDMARILRVPGTVNRKAGQERPCMIYGAPSYEHYDYDDLGELVDRLHAALPEPERPTYTQTPRPTPQGRSDGISPLDDMELRMGWDEILAGHFTYVKTKGHTDYWLRVGSTSGAEHSATTGHANDRDRFYSFTPESLFEARVPYNKQAVYTLLNFGGLTGDHFARATKHLRSLGFGGEFTPQHTKQDLSGLVRPATSLVRTEEPVQNEQPHAAALVVQADPALPTLGHDGLPVFTSDVYGTQHWDEMGLVSMYSGTFCRGLRYLSAVDEWRIWDGQRWTRDDMGRAFLASRKLLTGMLEYARKVEATGDDAGKNMVKKAEKLATLTRVNALVNVAKRDECVTASPRDFNGHKNLVTVENGTLNLLTGELTGFDPNLMLTKKIKAVYDPEAKGERTTKFLETIQPDPAMRTYMQRLAGYTLLGNADERVLPIVWGASGSGKSAFLEMLYHTLNDFASIADPSTLMPLPDTYQGPSEKLHSLMNSRFVKMSELPENASLNQALVKNITGSDTQKTRPLYGPLVEWQVEYTVWMATNNLPKITSTDDAIWKRVKPIHFPNVFVNEDGSVKNAADKDLGRQLARDEASFILNWLLEGIREYLKHGLGEPETVKDGVGEYRDNMDTVRQFMTEAQENGQIKVEEGQSIPARDLYKIYLAWAADANIKYTLALNTFKQRMLSNGYEQVKTEKANVWKGIGVAGFIGQAQTPSLPGRGRMRN